MLRKAKPYQFVIFVLMILIWVSLTEAQSKYPETLATLRTACSNEIQAHLNYSAYAQKANSENYPNIAYLFSGFAMSESIHARNFRQILSELGGQVKETPKPDLKVFNTKANLKNALDFELKDIDQRYPQLIEKIKPEKHEAAIRDITYAWESEKQHRDLIQKMQSGTGIFFGLLAKKIEETSVRYFVCQICGSTVVELPKDSCPICKGSVSGYKEVERIK
jgi:rubrerythrin